MRVTPESAQTTKSQECPQLGVVVIARNEARHIGACLDAIIKAVSPYPGTPIIIVDSCSSDNTVDIALQYPVSVCRYSAVRPTAAAGRAIGFKQLQSEYVLFIDGDCCIEENWLEKGIEAMNDNDDAAVVYGSRREVFESVQPDFQSSGPKPQEYSLGGNALYRSKALLTVGGFNPNIIAYEDNEILGRILANGYQAIQTNETMFTHYTKPKDTIGAFLARCRSGYMLGPGQVLRASIPQGLLFYYIRHFNRYLLTLVYLIAGIAALIFGVVLTKPSLIIGWLVVGALVVTWLAWRRRNIRSATYIAASWLFAAVGIVIGFFKNAVPASSFAPEIEQLSRNSVQT